MRAQLMELTPVSETWSRKLWWLNRPFTIAWQSSKVPSIASAWTLSSLALVIIRRCTSEMRPCGIQHEHVSAASAAERFDRGGAGVAGGRDHDGGALAARGQHMVHQPAEELHRQVLEGERRAVKQLQHELVGAVLRQWRHRRMAKIAIGFARHAGEVLLGNGVAHERPDHLDRHFGIGPAGKILDGAGVEPRPGFGHVEAAVAREPRERDLDKTERRSLAAGGYVTHDRIPTFFRRHQSTTPPLHPAGPPSGSCRSTY